MPQHEYVSITEMREEGFLESEFTTTRLRKIIRRASSKIDLFTKQFFVPEETTYKLDGSGHTIISLPNYQRIIKVDKIKICIDKSSSKRIHGGIDGYTFPDQRFFGELCNNRGYSVGHDCRAIELLGDFEDTFVNVNFDIRPNGFPVIFPEGSKNVEVKGVFGWLDNEKDVCKNTNSLSSAGNDFLQFDDLDGFDEFDQIIVRANPRPICFRVLALDFDNNRLIIDQLERDIPQGTEVCTYGAIPDQIVESTIRLAHLYSQPIYPSDPTCEIANVNDPLNRAIYKEKMDNYSWEADPKHIDGLWNRDLTNWASTGDLLVDRILQEFANCVPPYIGYV